jgi:enamine deaminase RidA (YjgF/YER057c/UK114 family)
LIPTFSELDVGHVRSAEVVMHGCFQWRSKMDIKYVGSGTRYSRAVIFNQVAYLAGNVAKEPGPTAAEQARMILSQIEDTLALCGTDKSKLLTATIVFADMRDFDAVNEVWDSWVVPGHVPTRTPIEAKLITPRHLVAMQVTAAI